MAFTVRTFAWGFTCTANFEAPAFFTAAGEKTEYGKSFKQEHPLKEHSSLAGPTSGAGTETNAAGGHTRGTRPGLG